MIEPELMEKYNGLLAHIASMGSAAVAFSAGVDSTFLLYAAKEALQDEKKILAVTASSDVFTGRELEEAKAFCKQLGVRQIIAEEDVFSVEGFADNPPDRCYHCKKNLFGKICSLAVENGMAAVLEGSNLDDMGDYRPGMRAVKELGVRSPLRQAGLTKNEIRILSRHFRLPTGDKPSFACLASRIPYGEKITKEKLNMIESAEQFLLDFCFTQMRVRLHETGPEKKFLARIELPSADIPKMLDSGLRTKIWQAFSDLGFSYVSLDLNGYRTGSLNVGLAASASVDVPSDSV